MNTAVKIGMRDYIKEIGDGAIGKSICGIHKPPRHKRSPQTLRRGLNPISFQEEVGGDDVTIAADRYSAND
jgi:hypothetical protein